MLISNLGRIRQELLTTVRDLKDAQLNDSVHGGPSVAAILHHLYLNESHTASTVLGALSGPRTTVADRSPEELRAALASHPCSIPLLLRPLTWRELSELLECSRFGALQRVFNETHVSTLAEKSANDPNYGLINLKNLLDTIWIHEEHHIHEIEEIRRLL